MSRDKKQTIKSLPGKELPVNNDAELNIISMIIGGMNERNEDNYLAPIYNDLSADDFFKQAHKDIFTAYEQLFTEGKPMNQVAIIEAYKKHKRISSNRIPAEIIEIISNAPASARSLLTTTAIKLVKEYSIKRKSIDKMLNTLEDIYAGQDVFDTVNSVSNNLADLVTFESSGIHTPNEVIKLIEEEIAATESGNVKSIPSGFVDIDRYIHGFEEAQKIVVGARPSVGKTAFLCSMLWNMRHLNIAFYSLEMKVEAIKRRFIQIDTGISYQKFKTPGYKFNQYEKKLLEEFKNKYQKSGLQIIDGASSDMHIRSLTNRLNKRHPLDLVCIDYFGYITPKNYNKNYSFANTMGEMGKNLWQITDDTGAPLIILSQLNRDPEKRPGKRPILSDLRDTGTLEQDADITMLLYRPEKEGIYEWYDDHSSTKGQIEVNIAKNRNGPIGAVKLAFIDKFAKVDNLDTRHQYQQYEDPPNGYAEDPRFDDEGNAKF